MLPAEPQIAASPSFLDLSETLEDAERMHRATVAVMSVLWPRTPTPEGIQKGTIEMTSFSTGQEGRNELPVRQLLTQVNKRVANRSSRVSLTHSITHSITRSFIAHAQMHARTHARTHMKSLTFSPTNSLTRSLAKSVSLSICVMNFSCQCMSCESLEPAMKHYAAKREKVV